MLRLISHFPSPSAPNRIWLERFTPHFDDRKLFPITKVRVERSYVFVYPEGVDLDRLAYFFEYDMGDTVPDEARDTEISVGKLRHSRTASASADWP